MNPFDNLTARQKKLVKLALEFFKAMSHGRPEESEYAELLIKLEQAVDGP